MQNHSPVSGQGFANQAHFTSMYDRTSLHDHDTPGVSQFQHFLQRSARAVQEPVLSSYPIGSLHAEAAFWDTPSQSPLGDEFLPCDQVDLDDKMLNFFNGPTIADGPGLEPPGAPSLVQNEFVEHQHAELLANPPDEQDGSNFTSHEDVHAFAHFEDTGNSTDYDHHNNAILPNDRHQIAPTSNYQQYQQYQQYPPYQQYPLQHGHYRHTTAPAYTIPSVEDPATGHFTTNYSTASFHPIESDLTNSIATNSSATQEGDTTATSFVDTDDEDILQFDSLSEAMDTADPLTQLAIKVDDWDVMLANPKPYVSQIVGAFRSDGIDNPHGHVLDAENQALWIEYQQEHHDKVAKHVAKHRYDIEVAAWKVFQAVIDAHSLGIRKYKVADHRELCSIRFREVVLAVGDYNIIRWDIIRGQRIDELVKDPVAFIARKMCNFAGNKQKKKRDKENVAACEEAGVKYNPVLGTKRKPIGSKQKSKRSTTCNPPRDDEPETEESLVGLPVAPKPSKKRKANHDPTPEEEVALDDFTVNVMRPIKRARKTNTVIAQADDV